MSEKVRLYLLIGGFLAPSLLLADQSSSLLDYGYRLRVFLVGSRWHGGQPAPPTPPEQSRSDEGLR